MAKNIRLSLWRRFSIGRKLALVPSLFILALVGVLSYTTLQSRQQKTDAVVMDMAGRQRMLNQKYLKEVLLAARDYKTDYAYTRKIFNDTLEALINGGPAVLTLGKEQTVELPPAPNEEIRAKLAEQKKLMAELTEKADHLLRLSSDSPAYATKLSELLDLGNTVHFTANDAVKLLSAHSQVKITFMIRAEIALGLLVSIVGGLCSWLVIRGIVTPLKQSVQVLEAVAVGDLTQHLAAASQDEVGRIAVALNQAVDSLCATMRSFSHGAQTLASSSEELTNVSQQMAATAEETSVQVGVVSAASDQVSKNIQTVTASVEEMGVSIREIAKNASDAARVAAQAVAVTETTNTTVAKLGASSAEISQVVKVITSIAEQTNLLALNATIEAARAGEAGKGFAVVANEVKELAKQTAEATEDISQKITTIQGDTQAAVAAIGQISGIINQINDISSTIASAVEEQSVTTSEIGRNVEEASKGSAEIAQNIGSVAQVAQSTASGATETQVAAQKLSRMATELQQLVSQFRYEEAGARSSVSWQEKRTERVTVGVGSYMDEQETAEVRI